MVCGVCMCGVCWCVYTCDVCACVHMCVVCVHLCGVCAHVWCVCVHEHVFSSEMSSTCMYNAYICVRILLGLSKSIQEYTRVYKCICIYVMYLVQEVWPTFE